MKLRDALTQMLGEFVASQKSPDFRLTTASNQQLNEAVKEERRNSIGFARNDWNPLPLSGCIDISDHHAGSGKQLPEVVLRVKTRVHSEKGRPGRPSSLIHRFRQRISPSRNDSIEENEDEEGEFDKKNSRESIRMSDTRSAGTKKDESGPALCEAIKQWGIQSYQNVVVSNVSIVPDEQNQIAEKLVELTDAEHDVIMTTGGTGFTTRDVTPEATLEVIHKRCSGLEVALHSYSLQKTPFAALSRAIAGIRNHTLIVNLPGSVKAVKECWEILSVILPHAVMQLQNTSDLVHDKLQHTNSP
ncbi:hypothetical protein WR25_14436 [Diploscapter pachys]|uniref:molybdopterin molybdotransferase n=1 Tax=Diploscapter pachys TaxID=2018661 RepID=A0A2A2JG46_9BILA|nr:hypothetical protein WR25_14436 [Diploscapter pachys]